MVSPTKQYRGNTFGFPLPGRLPPPIKDRRAAWQKILIHHHLVRYHHAKARASGCLANPGTTFYIERGRPFVSMSDYRDRHRSPEARIAVKLSRELTRLADDFPRFRLALNRLQHHVLVQVRSPRSKAYLLAPD